MVDSNIGQVGGVAIICMACAAFLFTGTSTGACVLVTLLGYSLLTYSSD